MRVWIFIEDIKEKKESVRSYGPFFLLLIGILSGVYISMLITRYWVEPNHIVEWLAWVVYVLVCIACIFVGFIADFGLWISMAISNWGGDLGRDNGFLFFLLGLFHLFAFCLSVPVKSD